MSTDCRKPLCTLIGAGPGLGAALARRFVAGGYRVALIGRDPARLRALALSVDDGDDLVRGFAADAGDTAGLIEALAQIHAWGSDSEVLIYNAAVMRGGAAAALMATDLATDMAVNLGGAVNAVAMLSPAMMAAGRGTILFTGGGLALEPYPTWTSLAIGKAALRAYGIALHKELAPHGIRVAMVAICGIIEPGSAFDPDQLAAQYWRLHAAPEAKEQRELVYLPADADPYYNDASGVYRTHSQPILGNVT